MAQRVKMPSAVSTSHIKVLTVLDVLLPCSSLLMFLGKQQIISQMLEPNTHLEDLKKLWDPDFGLVLS